MPSSRKSIIPTVLISSFIILAALSACKTGNFGRLQIDPEVTRTFESLEVLPNHKYFHRDSASSPSVVVAIHEDFTLNTPVWTEIDPQSGEFRRVIRLVGLQGTGTGQTTTPEGFKIFSGDGRYVGLWYSALRTAAVAINENNEITSLVPTGNITRGNR